MLNILSPRTQHIRQNMLRDVFMFGDWEYYPTTGETNWSEFIYHFYEVDDGQKINFFKPNTYYTLDDTFRMGNMLEKVLQSKQTVEGIFQLHLPSGRTAIHHSIFQPILGTNGDVEIVHIALQDITSQSKLKHEHVAAFSASSDFIDQLHEIVFQLDELGNIIFLNATWENMLGFSRDETLGRPLKAWVHSADMERFIDRTDSLIKNGEKEFEEEFRIVSKTGQSIWMLIRATKYDQGFSTACIAGTMLDITEKKSSNSILFQQRIAIENSREGIAVMSADSQYTYLNKAHVELFGYEDDKELLGQSWTYIYPPDEIDRIANEVFPEFLEKGFYRGKTKGVKKDGSFLFQDICLTTLPDGGLICITRDISDVVKKNEELQRLAIVAEKTNSVVIICDAKGCVEWVNDSFTEITGYTLEDVFGKRPDQIFLGPERDENVVQSIVSSIIKGENFKGEILSYKKDGTPIWLLIDVTPIFDERGKLVQFVSVETDITLLKNAEKDTLAALEKERELNQFKSHFINLASHEFRTPLATIQSSMDILNLRLFQDDSIPELMQVAFSKHHNRIEQEIKWMTEVMNNILILGKMDAGRMNFRPEIICMNELIRDVIHDKESLSDGRHSFVMNITGECYYMHVDPRLLRHIVMNLLSNAQKYSSANRLPEVTVEYLHEEVNIRVKDFGIGIPADEIQHLFTSFYRASNTENIQGTGLGLVIVKQLVDMHGGSVHVESTFGSGSEFIVNLPKQHIQNEESTSC